MSLAANRMILALVPALALAAASWGDNTVISPPAQPNQGAFAPALDNETAGRAEKRAYEKNRKAAMRKVAGASLVIILVLICFVVVVMIVTRRMRIRYLHLDKPVKFGRMWDVWWHGGRDRKDPPKS